MRVLINIDKIVRTLMRVLINIDKKEGNNDRFTKD